MKSILREVTVPIIGLVLVAIFDHWNGGGYIGREHLSKVVAVGYLLLGFALAYRLFCTIVLDLLVVRVKGRPVPKILKHMIGIAVFVVAVLISLNLVFSGAYTSLLTLSSVIAVVIGLALRPIILDVFSGLSANLDSAFHIGDWIQIARRGGSSTYTGWVEEINWRTTHLRTRAGNLIICPNSTLSTAIITNHSRPSRLSRYELQVKLPPELDAERGRQVLLSAALACAGRASGPASGTPPDVLITGMEASGVQYCVRFWLDPAELSPDSVTDTVARSVLSHLRLAGIPLSEKVLLSRESRVILDPSHPASRAKVLAKATLFAGVSPEVLQQVAEGVRLVRFAEGDHLIEQGASGSDMYLLLEGAVDVLVDIDGKDVLVAHMQAGDYFGEMSLLTGEPRTATIRAATGALAYQIGREAISSVIESDPGLMDLLSRNLAERNLNRANRTSSSREENPEEKQAGLAAMLLGKMKAIFRAGEP